VVTGCGARSHQAHTSLLDGIPTKDAVSERFSGLWSQNLQTFYNQGVTGEQIADELDKRPNVAEVILMRDTPLKRLHRQQIMLLQSWRHEPNDVMPLV
jgi:hypothetical protein